LALVKLGTIKMYATTWCGDCRMAKRWFDAHGIPYDYINIETDERAAAEVLRINRGMRSVPTIVFPDGSVLVEPSARELAAKCLQEPEPALGERLKSLYKGAVRRSTAQRSWVVSALVGTGLCQPPSRAMIR
jgi:mycoredoxin